MHASFYIANGLSNAQPVNQLMEKHRMGLEVIQNHKSAHSITGRESAALEKPSDDEVEPTATPLLLTRMQGLWGISSISCMRFICLRVPAGKHDVVLWKLR